MLVKLPLSTVSHIGPRDSSGSIGRLTMSVAYGFSGDEDFGTISLVEVEPDVWELRPPPKDLQYFRVGEGREWATGDCVTAEAVENLVGFVLPEVVEGRRLPRHTVMQEPDGQIRAYEDLDAVRAKFGAILVGHDWGKGAREGYLRCPRCREEKRCDHPAVFRRSVPLTVNPTGGTAEECSACGTELGRWVG